MKEATSQNLIKIIIFFPIFSFQYNLENNAQVGLFKVV